MLAVEFERLERGELCLTMVGERLAALAVLESSPPSKLPRKFLLAGLENSNARVQEAALRVVRQSASGDEIFLAPTLNVLHSIKSMSTRLEAIFTLGSFGNRVNVAEWLACVQSPSKEIAVAALRSLRQTEHPQEVAKAIFEAAPAVATREPDLSEDLLLTLQALGVQSNQSRNLPIATQSSKSKSELGPAVLSRLPKASATLGRLSFHSARAGCAKCHSTKPGDVTFGPNLADIGAASQPEYLIESILEPSKVLKTGFLTETIETIAGGTLSGLVEVASGKLFVKTSPDEHVAVPLDQVKSRAVSQLSPMPEGLETAMSEAELADLVTYLASLKGK